MVWEVASLMVNIIVTQGNNLLINFRPHFNMRLLNTEQVTKINEYGLKQKFRWARGKAKDRIKREWDTSKGINFDNIKQIRPGDIYYCNKYISVFAPGTLGI